MKSSFKLKIALFVAILAWPVFIGVSAENIIGINNQNLKKIAIAVIDLGLFDSDNDGIDDELEKAIGTNPSKKDSDDDSYNDLTEINNNYDPLGLGKLPIDQKLSQKLTGSYLLAVESRGELWLVAEAGKRFFVGNAERHRLLLDNFDKQKTANQTKNQTQGIEEGSLLEKAAKNIRSSDLPGLLSTATPDYKKILEHALNTLNAEQRLTWANMLSGAKLKSANQAEKIYTSHIYFGLADQTVEVIYKIAKQPDGRWLISQF
jgi:hypothetical protein